MKPEEILDAVGEVDDKVVLDAVQKKPTHLWVKVAAFAACLSLVLVGSALGIQPRKVPYATALEPAAQAEEGGVRKFINWNGCQYAFLEDGAPYVLPEELVGEPLGTVEHEIIIGREDHLKDNFAGTFGVGGTLYTVRSYDPGFRLALEKDGQFYLCERTGHTDDTPMDAAAYFETAKFRQIVRQIRIYDHNGQTVLKTVKGKKVEKLLDELSAMAPANLTNDQYQQIGEAQQAGKSFLLSLELNDETSYELYVIPELSIAMLGNDRYWLPEDFSFGKTFAKLDQAPMTVS